MIEIRYLSPIEVQIQFCQQESVQRQIFLLGTAHISEESARQTEEKIAQLQPDCICVELDQQRYDSLRQKERWQNLDLFRTLKQGKGFLLLVNLLLASFQKRIGRDLAIEPGQEMRRATELAEQHQIHLELADRPVEVTLKRAWASCTLWQKLKLLNALLGSLLAGDEVSKDDIEGLKEADALEQMIAEFSAFLPSIKGSLIDERDAFLARSIAAAPGKNVFAVLGAGHLRGICQLLPQILGAQVRIYNGPEETDNPTSNPKPSNPKSSDPKSSDPKSSDPKSSDPKQAEQIPQREELLTVPKKSLLGKALPWVIPLAAIVIMGGGFFFADTAKALQGLGVWAAAHSVLAGLAALLVLAHPLSILVAVVVSPFTALNPTISVGLVTALTEVMLRKPRIKDLEHLLEMEKWWQFRQNRIWHALIIFFVVSLGGAAATFIALPWLSVLLSG